MDKKEELHRKLNCTSAQSSVLLKRLRELGPFGYSGGDASTLGNLMAQMNRLEHELSSLQEQPLR